MQVSLISGYHVTAHEKKMIVAGVQNGWENVKSPRRALALRALGGNEYEARFSWKEKDDWGRQIDRRSVVTVKVQ